MKQTITTMVAAAVITTILITGCVTLTENEARGFGVGETYPSGLAVLDNTLYMVGQRTNALYILNPTTGIATRVGNVEQFGVGEDGPSGLAAIGTTLYMVGYNLDLKPAVVTKSALYTLNTSTGEATRVGNVDYFDVGEPVAARGLAAIGRTLYMVGNNIIDSPDGDAFLFNTSSALYTLNTRTGVATRVGNAEGLGVGEYTPEGLAALNGTLYLVTWGLNETGRSFYTLDTRTGVATPIGRRFFFRFGVDEYIPEGLAALNGTLYMIGRLTNALYTVDARTGRATRVGNE